MRRFLYALIILSVCLLHAQDNYDQSEKAFFNGDNARALFLINQEIENAPDAQDYLLRAMINESSNLLTNADDDFVKAISLDNEFYEAYFHYAEYLNRTGESEKAIASLTLLLNQIENGETNGIFFKIDQNGIETTKVTSLTSMEAELLTKRSLSYHQLGMIDLALIDINNAIIIEETVGRLVNRSLLFSAVDQYSKAITDLKLAISLSPENALAWYNLFILDQSAEMPQNLYGIEEFAPMLLAKGVEAMRFGDNKKAQDLFQQALKLAPNNVNLLLNAGRLDFKNQEFKLAQNKFERAFQLDPNKKEAAYLIGNAFFGQGYFTKAIEHYSEYIKTDPTFADVWFNTSMAYLELEDETNACMCLKRALDFGMTQAEPFLNEYCTKE